MKPIVVLAVIIGSGFAAPVEDTEELLRTKKSFGAPCAGAAPYAPVALYLSQSPQPHYREEEHFEEDQHQHARSSYDSSLGGLSGYSGVALSSGYGSGHSLGGAGLALSGANYGPAVGLFPNANVGGCNIPLLLSCAPNVVAGHLAHGYSSYSAPAYRNIEEEAINEDWAKMARKASHHKVSEDFPDRDQPVSSASHHVVSQDFPEPNLTRLVPSKSLDEKPTKL